MCPKNLNVVVYHNIACVVLRARCALSCSLLMSASLAYYSFALTPKITSPYG